MTAWLGMTDLVSGWRSILGLDAVTLLGCRCSSFDFVRSKVLVFTRMTEMIVRFLKVSFLTLLSVF